MRAFLVILAIYAFLRLPDLAVVWNRRRLIWRELKREFKRSA